jgi:hypothetical protein
MLAANAYQLLQCGRTFPMLFPVTLDEILQQSSPRFATSGRVTSRGELWTQPTAEWPNDAAVCSLSQILQVSVPDRYYLSPQACRGILRRAQKRGRELPAALQTALETVTGQAP